MLNLGIYMCIQTNNIMATNRGKIIKLHYKFSDYAGLLQVIYSGSIFISSILKVINFQILGFQEKSLGF